MRLLQPLEPMPKQKALAEVQRRLDISKPYRLDKEFLTSAGEKFPMRENRRSKANVW
jgi:hypothetical protein